MVTTVTITPTDDEAQQITTGEGFHITTDHSFSVCYLSIAITSSPPYNNKITTYFRFPNRKSLMKDLISS